MTTATWRDTGWQRDLITMAIGTWLVLGLFSDGWAHANRPELESFFTPWHGIIYAGLGASAGWFALLTMRGGDKTILRLRGLPEGYRAGGVGVIIFGIGGAGDLVWHQVFGLEVAVDALVSPTHLILATGAMLILTCPLRAQGVLSGDRRWTFPTVLSMALPTALIAFFLLYVSPFITPSPVMPFTPTVKKTPGQAVAELPVVAGLAAFLITTVLITVPLLLMVRGKNRPLAPATVLVSTIAWLSIAIINFESLLVAGALGATIGAIVADVVIARITVEGPLRLPLIASVVAVLVWSGQLTGFAIGDALRWPPSLWFGAIVVSGLAAAAMGVLATTAQTKGAP